MPKLCENDIEIMAIEELDAACGLLWVEMKAVTGEKHSALTSRIYAEIGKSYMAECDWPFEPEDRRRLFSCLPYSQLKT